MEVALEQILTQIVAFLIMLWVLKRFVWKPLLNIMDKRKQMIASEFDRIEEQKNDIKRWTQDYEEKLKNIESQAKAKIQEGIQKGQQLAQQIEQETREKAKQILNKAQQEVQREIAQAKDQLKKDVINLSVLIAQKLLRGTLDQDKHKELIKHALDQIELK